MTRYVRGAGETVWHVAEPWQLRAAEVQCGAPPDRNVWSHSLNCQSCWRWPPIGTLP
jgi:hypothetical protein